MSDRTGRAIGGFLGSAMLTLRRIAADQKRIWTWPGRARASEALPQALATIGITAALIALDPRTAPYIGRASFQESLVIRTLNRFLSGRNMAIVINGVPLAFFTAGLLGGRAGILESGLFAGEAAASAEILAVTMKHLDRRKRPIDVAPGGDYRRVWFRTEKRDLGGAGCFPSGHSASAFAVATVIAERHPCVRRLAYGAAGIVALSRLHSRAHYLSDVFFGSALGYSISHYVVMRRLMDAHQPEQQHDDQNGAEPDSGPAAITPAAITVVTAATTE